MPFQPILPTWLALNACNDTSASGFTDLRTGQELNAGGLNGGDYFDLTEKEANTNSNSATGILHEGRYRRVRVDSGATAANVKTGTIGLMATLALGVNVVTSYDKGLNVSLRPVIFLNVVTPGNWCFIQEQGDASVLLKTSLTNGAPAVGDIINSTTNGLGDDPTSQSSVATTLGQAMQVPVGAQLVRVLIDLPLIQG